MRFSKIANLGIAPVIHKQNIVVKTVVLLYHLGCEVNIFETVNLECQQVQLNGGMSQYLKTIDLLGGGVAIS